MSNVMNILDQIGSTTSRTLKEKILKDCINDEELKKILEYTYNPYKVYGIGKKSFDKKYPFSEFVPGDIIDLLDYLLIHNTGNSADKFRVNCFLNNTAGLEKEYCKRIILKDLKIGITSTTINKIWPGLVPTFKVQLANPFSKFYDDVAIEVKIDGCRCLTIKKDGIVNMFTRNGKKLEGFDEVARQLKALPIDNIVFDGEIIGKDYTDTMNNLFTKKLDKKATYMIFDMITPTEFFDGESNFDYETRKRAIAELTYRLDSTLTTSLRFMMPMETISKPTIEQLTELTNKAIAGGYEGIMIKPLASKYKAKRSNDWQKLKPFESDEFTITGFENGTGRFADTLGNIIVDVNGVSVRAGSGFSDVQRNEIWNNQEIYLGTQVEIQYQEKIEKTGSLRFPTIKSLRLDK